MFAGPSDTVVPEVDKQERQQAESTACQPDGSIDLASARAIQDFVVVMTQQVQVLQQQQQQQQRQQIEFLKQQQQQQCEFFRQMFNTLSQNRPIATPTIERVSEPDLADSIELPYRKSLATVPPFQAVSLQATQIPEYAGSDLENVQVWIRRVEQVARIYGASDDTVLLAASSKLTKTARKWYDMNLGTQIESWRAFRESIIERFHRKVLFHIALQKVEARKWLQSKESFHQYAMEKLFLIHDLELPTDSCIHLLISGITNSSLRATAAALEVDTVDKFLKAMHRITSVVDVEERNFFSTPRNQKQREIICHGCGKPGHMQNECRKSFSSVSICVYCKSTGHLRNECPKLKKRDPVNSSQSSPQLTPYRSTVASVTRPHPPETACQTPEDMVASVKDCSKTISFSHSLLEIVKLNNEPCRLFALIDTGSPISFVKESKLVPFTKHTVKSRSFPNLTYKAINNKTIDIKATCESVITLSEFPELSFPVNFKILHDNNFSSDVILGRDFLDANSISAVYIPDSRKEKNRPVVSPLFQVFAGETEFKEPMPLERELEYKQLSDPKLSEIALELDHTDSDKFELIEGLIYRKGSDHPRFVVPDSMIASLMKAHHDEMAHCGIEKTFQSIFATYWFPSMRKKIRDHIDNCIPCLAMNSSTHSREGEMQLVETSSVPFELLHIDHFGPLPTTESSFKYILVVIDSFSRFVWLFPSRSSGSKEVIEHLKSLFSSFGNPCRIISNRGTAFTSSEFSNFLLSRYIQHHLLAVASPWANGMVERVNRFLKSSLSKLVEEQNCWDLHINKVQYVINNTVQAAIKSSPSKVLLGYEHRNHSDKIIADLVSKLAQIDTDASRIRDESHDIARKYNKIYYDKKHKEPTLYKIGDYVLVRNLQQKIGQSSKLRPSYKGPYMISKCLNKNRYVVTDIPGLNVSARPYNTILSPNKIKPWIKPPEKNQNKVSSQI